MRRRMTHLSPLVFLALLLAPPLRGQKLETPHLTALAEAQVEPALRSFFEYLSIPNDAHFPEDIRKIIDYMGAAFQERGFETTELPTGGSALLFAEKRFAGVEKTVLVYLQSDGQPVDRSRWEQDHPFVPVLKEKTPDGRWSRIDTERLFTGEALDPDWRIFARSASDSKGPNIQFLAALDAMKEAGFTPDFNIKVIVDTEEELGSPHLPAAVEEHRDLLSADMLVIFDGPPHISGRPTLKFGARGISTFTLTTYGPRVAVHSGHYGNYAPNPALRLAQILSSMKDEKGQVTIPGFYDGIELDEPTRNILADVPDDEAFIHQWLGINAPDEVGANLQEAVQYPSLNIRGLFSGWVGKDRRTIVPPTATAEVDVRLVLESDPERLLRLIRDHIVGLGYHVLDREPTEDERSKYPRLATFTSEISYHAFRTDFDSEPGRWLTEALTHLYGKRPILIRTSGGSIPISPFVNTLDVPAVGVPTVNPDNNQHSPNENIRLGNFIEGIRVILAVLAQDLPGAK